MGWADTEQGGEVMEQGGEVMERGGEVMERGEEVMEQDVSLNLNPEWLPQYSKNK